MFTAIIATAEIILIELLPTIIPTKENVLISVDELSM